MSGGRGEKKIEKQRYYSKIAKNWCLGDSYRVFYSLKIAQLYNIFIIPDRKLKAADILQLITHCLLIT